MNKTFCFFLLCTWKSKLLKCIYVKLSTFNKSNKHKIWNINKRTARNNHLSGTMNSAEKGLNSKNITCRIKPLVIQLNLVMIIKYSKFVLISLNTFWEMGYIKVFAWQQQQHSDHNSLTFSLKQTNYKNGTVLVMDFKILTISRYYIYLRFR